MVAPTSDSSVTPAALAPTSPAQTCHAGLSGWLIGAPRRPPDTRGIHTRRAAVHPAYVVIGQNGVQVIDTSLPHPSAKTSG